MRGNVFKAPDQRRLAARSPRSRRLPSHSRSPGANSSSSPAGDDVDMTAAEFILTIGRGIGEEAKVRAI